MGFGPSFMKIWTCGSSPRSGSRNAWTRIETQRREPFEQISNFFWCDPNDFLSRLVTMDITWLYHHNPEQNNNQWGGGISSHPVQKFPSEKSSRLEFYRIKKASSTLITFQRAKLSIRNITHFCWCNWRIFWKEKAVALSPSRSSSCMKMPRLIGHLQPRRNWPTWDSSVLITHPIIRTPKPFLPRRHV